MGSLRDFSIGLPFSPVKKTKTARRAVFELWLFQGCQV